MTTSSQPRLDAYSRVTSKIIADLEQGVRPWQKPWSADHAAEHITRPLRANGQPYRGGNVLFLWSEALAKGYSAPHWMTYKQAEGMGAQVRKGGQRSGNPSSTLPSKLRTLRPDQKHKRRGEDEGTAKGHPQ